MWKNFLTAALVTSMLVLPVNSVSPAHEEEAPAVNQVYDYLPGRAPAQVSAEESMSPALHALVLALMNQEVSSFPADSSELAWEGLYNMLSLYGQLDWRTESAPDELLFPAETVNDYAAALNTSLEELGTLPASLEDRLTSDPAGRTFCAVCGEDGLSQIQINSREQTSAGLSLSGTLVYLPDDTPLARFQATLQPGGNMFGYVITGISLI